MNSLSRNPVREFLRTILLIIPFPVSKTYRLYKSLYLPSPLESQVPCLWLFFFLWIPFLFVLHSIKEK